MWVSNSVCVAGVQGFNVFTSDEVLSCVPRIWITKEVDDLLGGSLTHGGSRWDGAMGAEW